MAIGSTVPSIIPSAITGGYRYAREHLVDWRVVAWTGLTGAAAAVGGAFASGAVPGGGHPLMILTALMVGFTAWRLSRPVATPEPEPVLSAEGATDAAPGLARPAEGPPRLEAWRLTITGIGAGALSGLLGIGGGVLMVPAFTTWCRMPLKSALATSLACVGVLAIPSMITHALLGHIDWLYRWASSTARASTASSIVSVSRPVNVFCWLGWKQPRIVGPDVATSSPCAKRGRGRGSSTPSPRRVRHSAA